MPDYGIMLYGYSKEDAVKIKAVIDGVIESPTELMSGSGLEDSTVMQVIEKCEKNRFEDRDVKILMFLGDYKEQHFQQAMKALPRNGEIPRPIFCTLTQKNIQWKLTELIDDLVKEDKYWKEQNK